MKNIKDSSPKCLVCGINKWIKLFDSWDRYYGNEQTYSVIQCSSCGLVTLFPFPSKNEIDKSYPRQEYYSYSLNWEHNIFFSTRKYLILLSSKNPLLGKIIGAVIPLPAIPNFKKVEKILDIGCGAGQILKILNTIGWDTYGIEINKGAVDIARNRGLKNITCGSYTMLNKYPDNYFHSIRLYHVIEHLDNPDLCIKLAQKKLKPGGKLLIGTPNFGSLIAKISKRYWFGLDTPRHLFLFSPNNLKILIEKYGFKIKEIHFLSVGCLVGTLQFYLSARLGKRINLTNSYLLLIIFYPIDLLINLLALGDAFNIIAMKERK